jgi:hypothetical protein
VFLYLIKQAYKELNHMPKYGDIQTKKQSKAMFSLDNTKQSTIKMVANNNNNKITN